MSEIQSIVFGVADERYGVNVTQVQSIERLSPITRVPRTLSFIRGVMNLRGVVVPVIDLRERFGFPQAEPTDDTRIIIVSVEDMTVGMIVDSVVDVQMIAEESIDPAPSMVGGVEATYIHGVAKIAGEVLILLNLPKLLSAVETQQLQEAEKSVRG